MSADLDKLRAQIRDRDLEVYTGGYAQAVADIRQMIEDRRETVKRIGVTSRESGLIAAVFGVLGDLQRNLDAGAHVGAAKKGAT